MPRLNVPDDLGSWMGLRPEMAPGLVAFSETVYGKSKLPTRIMEVARMRIALANECEVCRNARYDEGAKEGMDAAFYANVPQWRTWSGYSERERLAAEYAEGIATAHVQLRNDEGFWKRLHQHYSDEEIVDLAICCALWLGTGRTMRVLDVGQSCALTLSRAGSPKI